MTASSHRSLAATVAGLAITALAAGLTVAPATAAPATAASATAASAAAGSETSAPGPRRSLRPEGPLSARLQTLATLAAAPTRRTDDDPATTLSLPRHGDGALVRDRRGRVLVQVRLLTRSATTRADLAGVGEVVDLSPHRGRATLLVAPGRLDDLAALPAVGYADVLPGPVHGPPVSAATPDRAGAAPRAPGGTARCRPLASEADRQLRAQRARNRLDVDGTGVTVGVLSDSYDVDPDATTYARDDVRSGDLPGPGNPCGRTTPVKVVAEFVADGTRPTDEGRAMLQGVHDLAPGAALAFATAAGGPDAFAKRIRALGRAGADVIVDDITYLTEPFFQQGVIDQAVSKVVDDGAAYVSSAGNGNTVFRGRDVSSWETPATTLADCPDLALPVDYGETGPCVAYDPDGTDTGYDLTIAPGGTISPVLQWGEPVNGVRDDFDLLVVDADSGELLASSTAVQSRSQTPVEFLSWTNPGPRARDVRVVVNRFSGDGTPRLKLAFLTMTGLLDLEHDRSVGDILVGPTVFGHNGGVDAVSVAAVPYDDAGRVAAYSSRGPVTHYFGPVKGTDPARVLTTPEVIRAPQVAATDGWQTTFFGNRSGGRYRFYGTSAAAPVAAAVAALMRQAYPGLSPKRLRGVLERTARPVGQASPAAAGAGLIDADAAVAYVAPAPAPIVTATKAKRGAIKVWFQPAPPRAGGAPITGYQVRCVGADGQRTVTRSGSSSRPVLVDRLHRGSRYACSVRAVTGYAPGVYSVPGPARIARGKPSKPRHVRAQLAGPRALQVSFRPPRNTGGRALTGFTATCRPRGDHAEAATRSRSTTAGAARELRVRKLTPGPAYRCEVRARNAIGTSAPSHRTPAVRIPR